MTDIAPPVPAPTARRTARGWAVVGVLGELLITFGVVLLLFVVYQLLWTNVTADRAAGAAAEQLQETWSRPPTTTPEVDEPDRPPLGDAFALMYIPRLRDKVWGLPVLESVSPADLARGIGHYPTSQLPGETGNFAVAGHRATNGEPLRNIDLLQVGDPVYVETRDAWYEYRLERDQIVTPQDNWVIDPVPGQPGAAPSQPLITVTTCNPRWASTQRWIWWGSLTQRYDKAAGEVPAEVEAG